MDEAHEVVTNGSVEEPTEEKDEQTSSNGREEEQGPPMDDLTPALTSSETASDEGGGGRNRSLPMQVLDKVIVVFPKVEPLPWLTFFSLSLKVAVPAAIYVLFFTRMGFGMDAFYYLAENYGQYASSVGVATAAFFLVLYLLDFTEWESRFGIFCRRAGWIIFVLGVCLLVLLMTGDYPFGPICLFAFLCPMWLVMMKGFFYPEVRTRVYISWLSGPLFFISALTGITWLVWTFVQDENEWNEVTRVASAEATGCEPDFEKYPDCRSQDDSNDVCFEVVGSSSEFIFEEGCDQSCTKVYDSCLNAFILWVGPLLVGMVLFFLSFFCTFLRAENSAERDIINFGKLWIFLLFTMWLTASLAGVASGVASALIALTLASFVGSAVFLASSMSRSESKAQASDFWERIRAKYGPHLDVARGLLIVTCAPIALIYVVLSFLNQMVRKIGLPCTKTLSSEEEKADLVTKRTRRQINTFKSWDRSKVYTYAIYWGIAFMILQVIVAQFTVLFLSWLIEKTSSLSLWAVTGILVGVGLLMFLLPPVPGVPIYLTLGIVILATGRDILGIIGSMCYAAAVSLALKLLACTLQQKLIGENLAHSVSVRKFVGINTTIIKAMRIVLAQRGMGIDKVSILVGGPDWPTSVLCGIMKLDLFPILFGTLPVFFLILPTMLTGSFTYMSGLTTEDGAPEFPWAGVLATVFAAITAIVQFGSMIVAAFYLEQTTSKRGDEIAAIPVDEEVAEAEAKEEHLKTCYTEATQWHLVPLLAKFTILLSLTLMVACCYMVQLFSNSCFADYQLTYTIEEDLGGDWTNLILPLGQVAILLFLVSCVLLYCFTSWAKYKAKTLARGSSISPEDSVYIQANESMMSDDNETNEAVAYVHPEIEINIVENSQR